MTKTQSQKIYCGMHWCRDFFYGAQPIRNAAETYNIFFADFLDGSKYGRWCISQKNLRNKISENPLKGFLQSLDRGMNKIKKKNIFSNSTSLKLSFALCQGILLPPVAVFWATLMYKLWMWWSHFIFPAVLLSISKYFTFFLRFNIRTSRNAQKSLQQPFAGRG